MAALVWGPKEGSSKDMARRLEVEEEQNKKHGRAANINLSALSICSEPLTGPGYRVIHPATQEIDQRKAACGRGAVA